MSQSSQNLEFAQISALLAALHLPCQLSTRVNRLAAGMGHRPVAKPAYPAAWAICSDAYKPTASGENNQVRVEDLSLLRLS